MRLLNVPCFLQMSKKKGKKEGKGGKKQGRKSVTEKE